jgi:hypothetical protein
MNTVGLEFMILHLFVVVFFDGFVLMLGILSLMRCLYALDVCQRPQISTDPMRHISFDRFEKSNTPNRERSDGSIASTEPRVWTS